MLNKQDLAKQIKLIVQDAWRVETNTTMNSMMEYIVREVSELLLEEIDITKSAMADILETYDELYLSVEGLKEELEELKNGSKNGGIQKPERNTKSPGIKARKTNESIAA